MFKILGRSNDKEEQELIEIHNSIFLQKESVNSDVINDDGEYLSHLSNCLVTLVPVSSEEPFQLFGSKNKSLVANKLSVHQALYNKNNIKDVKAGKVLIEMLISDEMLSSSMINMNSFVTPVTYRNIGGNPIDPNSTKKSINSLNKSEHFLDQELIEFKEDFNNYKKNIFAEMQKVKPSKKSLNESFFGISCLIDNVKSNFQYSVDVLSESLSKDINSVKSELLSTIEKLSFYKNKMQELLINSESNLNNKSDLLYWFANGGFNHVDFEKYISTIEKVKGLGTEIQKYIENLKQIKGQNKKEINLSHGAFSMSSVYGKSTLCNNKNNDGRFVELRFSNGYEHLRHSDEFKSDNEFLRISISFGDILYLLRGTHNTDYVIGTISRYAKTSVPVVLFEKDNEETISKKQNIGKLKKTVSTQFNKVSEIANGNIKKAERLQIKDEIEKLEELFNFYVDDCFNDAISIQDETEVEFKDIIQKSLDKELKTINNQFLSKTLKLFGNKK